MWASLCSDIAFTHRRHASDDEESQCPAKTDRSEAGPSPPDARPLPRSRSSSCRHRLRLAPRAEPARALRGDDGPITLTVSHVQRLRVHRRAARRVHEGAPQRHRRAHRGPHLGRGPPADAQGVHHGRRLRARGRRGGRGRLAPRADAALGPLRGPDGPGGHQALGGLEGRRRPRPRTASCSATAPTSVPRPSATAPTCSRRPACRPTARRSRSCSVARTPRGSATSRWASEFAKKSDVAWFDGATGTFQGMVNQLPAAFEDPATQEPTDLATNNEVRAVYDQITGAIGDGLSAGLGAVVPRVDRRVPGRTRFATMLCPGWMMGAIESYSAGVQGWDIANVFPGGGGNWGGSFLTVPSAGALHRGGEGARRVAHRTRAADQGLRDRGRVPVADRGAGLEGGPDLHEPVLQQRPGRQGLHRAGPVHRRRAVQGPELLRDPRRGQQRADRRRHRQQQPGDRLEPGRADRRGHPAAAMSEAGFAHCFP